jgi:hypothetical protein
MSNYNKINYNNENENDDNIYIGDKLVKLNI